MRKVRSRGESGQVGEKVTQLKDDDDGREKQSRRDDWRCDGRRRWRERLLVKLRGKVGGAAYRLLGRFRHRPGGPGRSQGGYPGTLGAPGSLWETLGPLTEGGTLGC